MNILLTGATGFLGSALAKYWTQAGHQLTVLVRPTSLLHRIEALLPAVQIATCASDADIVECVLTTEPDVIVHTACSYGRLGETALQIFDSNIRLGMLLLDGAIGCSAKSKVSFINTGTVLEPAVSLYALSKQQLAQWGDILARKNPEHMQFVNVRLQHMYGPGDDKNKFTSHVLHACYRNQPQLALTAGEQQRDFIYIDDVVSAYDLLINNLEKLSQSDEIDIGSGEAPTLRSFVEKVHMLTASLTQLQFGAIPYRANEAMMYKADTRRLHDLGWQPTFSLDCGLRKTIELEFNT